MREKAFTLVELLVSVTIILVLVSLLLAALDNAHYQVRLTHCQSQQKAIVNAVITYAGEHNRQYPYRHGVFADVNWSPAVIADLDPNLSSLTDATSGNTPPSVPAEMFDDRIAINERISINQTLNCAFVNPVDLENASALSRLQGSQALWYGWRFKHHDRDGGQMEKGMFKLGDRFEWRDPVNGDRFDFSVLVSDWTGFNREDNVAISSHPDFYDSILYLESRENAQTTWWKEDLVSYSFWVSSQTSWPGPIDRVFSYDDGSSRRSDRIHWRTSKEPEALEFPIPETRQGWQRIDDRTVPVPERSSQDLRRSTHLPRNDH